MEQSLQWVTVLEAFVEKFSSVKALFFKGMVLIKIPLSCLKPNPVLSIGVILLNLFGNYLL